MNHYNARIVALLFTVAIAVAGFGGVMITASAQSGSIVAGSNAAGNVSVTVFDATTDSTDNNYAIEITNNRETEEITIESVEFVADNSTESFDLGTAVPLPPGETHTVHTNGTGTNSVSDTYLGWETPEAESGTIAVYHTYNSTQHTVDVTYDINQDDDFLVDSLDPYPQNALETSQHTVNTSEGSAATAYADIAAGTGTTDVTLYKLNQSSSTFEQIDSQSVTADSSNATLVEFDISGAEDGTQYMIETHGIATVTETGLTYDALSGGGGDSDSPNLPENAEYAVAGIAIVGAAVLLIRAGGDT